MTVNLNDLSASELTNLQSSLTDDEKTVLLYDWPKWARKDQRLPGGDWDGWLIIAGRYWGKTHTGANTVREEVESGRSSRIALVGETSADGKDVLVNGLSGIIAISPPWNMPTFTAGNSNGRPKLKWPSGAIATLFDAREPDQLRGPQHDFVWLDELAKFRYAEAVFEQAMLGLRVGDHPRWMATTTPRPIALLKRLLVQTGVVVTRGPTSANSANIVGAFQRTIDRLRGTRLGRQELDAEILDDVPGALWSRRSLDEARVSAAPALLRIVVGVDPAASSGETANENGIIVGGIGANGHAYIIEDWSLRGSPDEWARKAVAAFRKHSADALIAECNQGGEMVARVIQSVADIPVKLVRATRGKYVRAEPVSALYEQGRVHHVGVHPELEDQMISFTPERAADRADGYSPDRVDALVWTLTELFPDITAGERTDSAVSGLLAGSHFGY